MLRLLAKRNVDLGSHRTRVVCHLHALLAELAPGGIAKEMYVSDAERFLANITPQSPTEQVRHDLALELLDDVRRLDEQTKQSHRRIRIAIKASGTSLTPDLRSRSDHRRAAHRLCRRCSPVRQPRCLRLLQRDGTGRVRLGWTSRPPRLSTREPPAQPRAAHGCRHPDPKPWNRGTHLFRAQGR